MRFFWKNRCGSMYHAQSSTQETNSQSTVVLSMETVNTDQTDSPREEQDDVRNAVLTRNKQYGHSNSTNPPSNETILYCRRRSKSFDSEIDQMHQRPGKLQRFNRWKLVESIVPMLGSMRRAREKKPIVNQITSLNTRLLDAIENQNNEDVESILKSKDLRANPNSTCHVSHVSACHAAAYGNSEALRLLLDSGTDKNRRDKFGRTPLHLAAWAGSTIAIAMLLGFPADLQKKLEFGMTEAVEEDIKTLSTDTKSAVDVICELKKGTGLPSLWKDSIEHKCRKYLTHLPKFFPGWTALHIASYAAHHDATRLLLAAGANPNAKDAMGQTPLDVAGAACYLDSTIINLNEYKNTIKTLIEFEGKLNVSSPILSNSALHTAVELSNIEAIQMLLKAGAPIWHLNENGNTALHECVDKHNKEALQVLVKYCTDQPNYSINVVNIFGYTVLQSAIIDGWIPGVCVALEGGADVTFEAHDGKTALHIAALKGDLDILDEILCNAGQCCNIYDAVNYNNRRTEPPIFCAIRSGNLDCVQTFLDAGAVLRLNFYVEPIFGTTINPISEFEQKSLNIILHATAEAGNVNMIELLLNHDKNLEELLSYKCTFLDNMTPVEFAAYHNRFHTFSYLLQKTLKREHKLKNTFDHSRLLNIIAIENHEDLFKELMRQIPDAVRKADKKVYYPLHDAARNSNRNMIAQLIQNGADLSEVDDDGITAISLVIDNISKPAEFLTKILDSYIQVSSNNINSSDCEIVIDYSIFIPNTEDISENNEQLRLLTSLLNTKNRQAQKNLLAHPLVESFLYLKWKTLSSYFYLILILNCLFVLSLSIYTISSFHYKDEYNATMREQILIPNYFNPSNWRFIVYTTLGIVVTQELSRVTFAPDIWIMKMLSVEFWIKLLAYTFAVAACLVLSVMSEIPPGKIDWPRYLATVALIMAWLNIMIMLSKMYTTGYYIHMFWVVSSKVLKILATFILLIVMFSLCFMIQFHSHAPFDDPWAAFVKTLVMMTSEFDYEDTFPSDKAKYLSTPIEIIRLVFVIFMILTAIVLMNLMIGVAVNDVQHLIHDGNLKRLEKQVMFLSSLEISGQKSILNFLWWFRSGYVPQIVKIKPVNDGQYYYDTHIKEAVINKAQQQLDNIEKETESNKLESKFEKLSQELSSNLERLSQDVLRHVSKIESNRERANINSDKLITS